MTQERYRIDPALAREDVPQSLKGHDIFLVEYEGRVYEAVLRAGHVKAEFIALARKSPRSAEEEAHLPPLKLEMMHRLAPLAAESVYDLRIVKADD